MLRTKFQLQRFVFEYLHYYWVYGSRIASNFNKSLVTVKDTNSTVGTGPCAKWFKGEDCPFYPKFAIKEVFKVGCADAEGSYCDCIYFCWNNEDVTKFFAMGLKSEEYDDCTTRLNFSLILAGSVGSVSKI